MPGGRASTGKGLQQREPAKQVETSWAFVAVDNAASELFANDPLSWLSRRRAQSIKVRSAHLISPMQS